MVGRRNRDQGKLLYESGAMAPDSCHRTNADVIKFSLIGTSAEAWIAMHRNVCLYAAEGSKC